MTPKEKAKELVTKYASFTITTLGCGYEKGNPCIITNVMFKDSAKQCALIAVDEVINSDPQPYIAYDEPKELLYSPEYTHVDAVKYWQQVKQEIEKL